MRTHKPKSGSVYQRGSVWWIKYYKDGKPIRESSQSESAGEATRLLKRRQGEIVTGKFAGLGVERVRFSELFEDLLDEYRRNERKSLVHVEARIRLHLMPVFGEMRVTELNTHLLHAHIAKREKAKSQERHNQS